jgi:hypothetical protein
VRWWSARGILHAVTAPLEMSRAKTLAFLERGFAYLIFESELLPVMMVSSFFVGLESKRGACTFEGPLVLYQGVQRISRIVMRDAILQIC